MKALLTHRLRGHRVNRRDEGSKSQEIERSLHSDEDENKRRVQVNRRERAATDDHWDMKRGINCKTGRYDVLSTGSDVVSTTFPSKLKQYRRNKAEHSSSNKMKRLRHGRKPRRSRMNDNVNVEAPTEGCRFDTSFNSLSRSSCASAERLGSYARLPSSVDLNATFLFVENEKPDVVVDVRYSGMLSVKRGLLKKADKRYFFLVRARSELFSCKNEMSFNLWLASGHALDSSRQGAAAAADNVARASGLHPVLVGTVLRAEAESEEEKGSPGLKTFQVMIQSTSKCSTLMCAAPSSEKAMQWLEALQEIQVTKTRRSNFRRNAVDRRLGMSRQDETSMEGEVQAARSNNESDLEPKRSVSSVAADMSRVEDDVATVVSSPASHTDSSPTSAGLDHADYFGSAARLTSQSARFRLGSSCSSTASGHTLASSKGNVLLFVPVAGSALTASATRMTKARQELDTLVANGAKLPSRVMVDPLNGEAVVWRYGVPDYLLTDLAYVKGREREPDTTPLASYVEECCQTFILEATHKARYEQWQSVCQRTFFLQVNDGLRVPGSSIHESDMLGLLYLGGAETRLSKGDHERDERQDPRAELPEAFPDGFPMEVLQVYTQPPQCYFSWRHWGPFTGKFRGVKGDGSTVELRGFGEMTVDASRLHSLRLFFKLSDLFSGLEQATDRKTRARRGTVSSSSLLLSNVALERNKRAASTCGVPVPVIRKGSVPNPKTSDIIEGLANFTLEATKQHRKQTQ